MATEMPPRRPTGPPIRLTVEPAAARLAPGAHAELLLTVRNTGAVADRCRISVTGLQRHWYTLGAGEIMLAPGEDASVPLSLHPTAGPAFAAGRYPFRVQATLQGAPASGASAIVDLAVETGGAGSVEDAPVPSPAPGPAAHPGSDRPRRRILAWAALILPLLLALGVTALLRPHHAARAPAQPAAPTRSAASVVGLIPTPGSALNTAIANREAARGRPTGVVKAAVVRVSMLYTPATLRFSTQAIGATGTEQTVHGVNLGPVPLTIGRLSIDGDHADFRQHSTCAYHTVGVGAACVIVVRFAPTARGARHAILTIVDNTAGRRQEIQLDGRGR